MLVGTFRNRARFHTALWSLPSTNTERRTRAYRFTVYMPPVSGQKTKLLKAPNLVRHANSCFTVKFDLAGGVLLLRNVTPLSRRNVVYGFSGAYTGSCEWPYFSGELASAGLNGGQQLNEAEISNQILQISLSVGKRRC
jgi:hypothetical protein